MPPPITSASTIQPRPERDVHARAEHRGQLGDRHAYHAQQIAAA